MDSARYALADQHHFVVRAIRGMLADPNAAEDAAQDAWLGALRRGGSYGVGWLVQAARHAGLDGRRRDAARGAREARDARERGEAFAEAPDAALERVERRQRVAETVLQLDEPLRAVVLLRYEEGRTCIDIASRLGVDETTVRRRLARAHEELRRRLDHEFGDRAAWAGLAAPLGVGQTWAAGTPLVLTAGLVVAAGVAFLALLTLLRPSDGASSDSGASLGALSATPETRNGEGLALRAGSAEFDRAPAALVVQEPRPVSDAAPRAAATHERLLARAELLDRKRFDDYERATFSFQHGRRDDPGLEVTGNDWELLYSGGAFDVVTVVDDQSWIAPLGALDPLKLAESLPKELRWSTAGSPTHA